MTSADDDVHDDLTRDLYLFFELVCQRCMTTWEPTNPRDVLSTDPEEWADQFSRKFAAVAQALGWGSVAGKVVCPSCLAKERSLRATRT